MSTYLALSALFAFIAACEFIACRTAWRWGDYLPERFAGLEKFFALSGPSAAVCACLAIFFGFVGATASSLDENGGAASWQLVAMSPVLAALAVSGVVFFGVLWWDNPPIVLAPALRGTITLAPEDRQLKAIRRRLAGQPSNISTAGVEASPVGRHPRLQAVKEAAIDYRYATGKYARAMFLCALLPTAAGVLLGLGFRGAGGILPAGVVFVPFTGAGVLFATYGVLVARRRLPSVLHDAVPPRGGGIALAFIGVALTLLGLAVQIVSVASIVAAVGGAGLLCVAAVQVINHNEPRLRAGNTPHLAAFTTLILGAVVWAAFLPSVLR